LLPCFGTQGTPGAVNGTPPPIRGVLFFDFWELLVALWADMTST
jgi:hypothetical protein